MKVTIPLLVCAFLIAATVGASGHQPRIVRGQDATPIAHPETTQAFYGELQGNPAYYEITSKKPFKLYVGILVPDLEDIGKDVSVEITKEDLYGEEKALGEDLEAKTQILLDG